MDNVVFFIFLAIPITIKGYMYKGYLGCFEDSQHNRVINDYNKTLDKTNGPEICSNICIKEGFRYAGTEFGKFCFCGNKILRNDSSDECNTPCRNNPGKICGGQWKLSLYDTWMKSTTSTSTTETAATTTSRTTTTTPTYSTMTVHPLDSRNKTKTTTDLIGGNNKYGLDEDSRSVDSGSGINSMYIIIPCVMLVIIAFIIGLVTYYRRKKSRGNNNNEMELQKHESSKQTANDEEENNTIDDENAVSNQNQLDDLTTEGDYMDVDDQAAAASVAEDDEYNILSLKGTHVGPVKKGLNTGQGTLSNNTYSHLHELYPSTDDTYSHTNSNYPNKISNTQDNIYDHTGQGMIQASNMELDNTYNTLTLPNTKGMEQTSAADLAVHREDDVDLYNSVEEPVLKQANIDLDDYSHLADFDINN